MSDAHQAPIATPPRNRRSCADSGHLYRPARVLYDDGETDDGVLCVTCGRFRVC